MLIHGLPIPSSCEILFFMAMDFTFTTRHSHNWVSFLLWPNCFILSGAISHCSPLFFSSILDTLWPGELIFWYHIFLPFHTVHGVLGVRMLEWFAIPTSRGSLPDIASRNINNLKYADDHSYGRKWRTKEPLDESEKSWTVKKLA